MSDDKHTSQLDPTGDRPGCAVPSSLLGSREPRPVEPLPQTGTGVALVRLGHLLDLVAQDPQHPRLCSALEVCCQLIGAKQVRQTRIDAAFLYRPKFGHLLENDGYSKDEVREIRGLVAYCLEYAMAAGWQPYQYLPEAWKAVLELDDSSKCMEIVLHFAEEDLEPKDVTFDGVLQWLYTQVAEEIMSFQIAKRIAYSFIRLMENLGLPILKREIDDPVLPRSLPFEELPPKLQAQVNAIVDSKCHPGEEKSIYRSSRRPWSPATAANLKKSTRVVYAYLKSKNVEGVEGVEQVFREPVFRALRSELEKRKCLPGTIRQVFAPLISVARSHPMFPKEHFRWLRAFQKEMPKETQEDVRRRKDGRFLLADVLLGIPSKIREDRLLLEQTHSTADRTGPHTPRIGFRRARLAMFELIMGIIVRLAWPPRMIYRCRIDGPNPNLFFDRIDPDSDIKIDDWFKAQHAQDKNAKCWQYRFSRSDTGSQIKQGMWPLCLIQPLKEFIELRKALVRGKTTDTLFANCFGGPLTEFTLRDVFLFITIKYAFKALPPQLCRENFAEAYIHDRPWDIMGLSTILGIGPALTEKLFGQHLNPSCATPAVESWHAERQAKASIEPGALGANNEPTHRPIPPQGAVDLNLASVPSSSGSA